MHKHWSLYIDGAARNNPGPAGVGIYLLENNVPVLKQGVFLGDKTNNQAEYIALLLGLWYTLKYINSTDKLVIKSDSQLLVRQITGEYKIKNKELEKLYYYAKNILNNLNYRIVHIVRADNKVADSLANFGIDKKISVPPEFVSFLERL